MQFNLHADYVKAAAPESRSYVHLEALAGRSQPPPGYLRHAVAVVLAGAARRLDGEAARRAVA